jgi:phytoene synthase
MHRFGLQWGLCDLALHLGDEREREVAASLARLHDVRKVRVRRPLRPLLVLHGLARSRLVADDPASEVTPRAMMRAMRLGLLGF